MTVIFDLTLAVEVSLVLVCLFFIASHPSRAGQTQRTADLAQLLVECEGGFVVKQSKARHRTGSTLGVMRVVQGADEHLHAAANAD